MVELILLICNRNISYRFLDDNCMCWVRCASVLCDISSSVDINGVRMTCRYLHEYERDLITFVLTRISKSSLKI